VSNAVEIWSRKGHLACANYAGPLLQNGQQNGNSGRGMKMNERRVQQWQLIHGVEAQAERFSSATARLYETSRAGDMASHTLRLYVSRTPPDATFQALAASGIGFDLWENRTIDPRRNERVGHNQRLTEPALRKSLPGSEKLGTSVIMRHRLFFVFLFFSAYHL